MRFFEFGTAPAAAAFGYKMVSVVQARPEELASLHADEDIIFVYGAESYDHPGIFDFARFERSSQPSQAVPASERLFIGIYPCGIVYSDRSREDAGDYVRLAFLPYSSLALELRPDVPEDLLTLIQAHAQKMRARAGEQFQISTAGQSVVLGSKLS